MADSSARNLNYQQSQQQTEQPKKAIVLNPKAFLGQHLKKV